MTKPIALFVFVVSSLAVVAQPPNGGRRGGYRLQEQQERYTGPLTNYVSITTNGAYRVIQANGIPDHPLGQFPNSNNPNSVSPQQYNYRVPLHPQIAARETKLRMQPFGIAINGVVFDPSAAEWWQRDQNSGWQYEPFNMSGKLGLDQYNAHVQPNGAYHYHGIPLGLIAKLTGDQPKMIIVGWAADGFPIYGPWCNLDPKNLKSPVKKMTSSYRVRPGARNGAPGGKYDGTFLADYEYVKGAGDLDECNGRFGPTADFPAGTYYYVLTEQYPFIPRIFKGQPDMSFERHGPPNGGGGPGMRRGGQSSQGGPPNGQNRNGSPNDRIGNGPPDGQRNGPPQGQGNSDQSRPSGPPPDNQ